MTGGGGTVTMSGTYTVASISGTTVTLSAIFQGSGSATGASFSAGGATDVTADGGGLTLKAAADKTISWDASTDAWVLNVDVNLPSGKGYYINGTNVLSATEVLGKSIATDFGTVDNSSIPTTLAVENRINSAVTAVGFYMGAL